MCVCGVRCEKCEGGEVREVPESDVNWQVLNRKCIGVGGKNSLVKFITAVPDTHTHTHTTITIRREK